MSDFYQWLENIASAPEGAAEVGRFTAALIVSFGASVTVAVLYERFYSNRIAGSEMQRCFLLLGPSITTLFFAIQFSVSLSLGLFGVFAIIRFRNPVRDPEDIGFLTLLLASAVICATSQFRILAIFLLLTTGALLVRKYYGDRFDSSSQEGVYMITMNLGDAPNCEQRIMDVLKAEVPRSMIQSFSYSEDSLTIRFHFSRDGLLSLKALRTSLEEIAPVAQLNVLFANQGSENW